MHLDLHLHSTCSDGSLAPAELAAAAHRAGLDAIAVTDHDTAAGVAEAGRAAAALGGPMVIPGVELSCSLAGAEVHLLGYGIDPDHAGLAALTGRTGERRRRRMDEMVGRLRDLGVPIAPEDVRVAEDCVSVGRPHVASALVRLGVVQTTQEAFDRFLADGGPAHVPSCGPDVGEAIRVVEAAGGCSVWAHPAIEDARHFGALEELGLGGVETLRPWCDPATSLALEHEARALGLFVTGGSDWHGGRPPLGSWFVTERHVGAFLERLGITPS